MRAGADNSILIIGPVFGLPTAAVPGRRLVSAVAKNMDRDIPESKRERGRFENNFSLPPEGLRPCPEKPAGGAGLT